VYTGNAHPQFARDICSYLDIPLGEADVTKFANDNIFVKINENAREHDVYVVQSLVGPSVSDAIMELLIMLDAFKRASAGSDHRSPARRPDRRRRRGPFPDHGHASDADSGVLLDPRRRAFGAQSPRRVLP
jgi:hypothetical protein